MCNEFLAVNVKDQNDDTEIEQLLDQLLDAAEEEREQRLRDIESQDPALAGRARKLLAYALGEDVSVSETVDRVAPDLFAALVNEDEHDRIGEMLGPYRITEFIGRGGMGVVFLAERSDGAYEQSVAIKFTPRFVRSEHSRVLFDRERAHLARLEHPNIARIIDAGVTEDETPYYIMEYVDGERIDHFAGGLPERKRLLLFLQLCDAVAYCHRSLIIHGDIKPGNVLVSDSRVRLLDFGIGHLLDEAEPNEALADVHAFSPDYAAPEQREGDHPSIQSDIYSLGTLLQKLFTGGVPEDIAAIIESAARTHRKIVTHPSMHCAATSTLTSTTTLSRRARPQGVTGPRSSCGATACWSRARQRLYWAWARGSASLSGSTTLPATRPLERSRLRSF